LALQVIFLDEVSSTNQYAKRWSEEHANVDEVAVFAKYQSSGKGQRGRVWESRSGENLLGSFLVRDCIPSQLVGLNLAAALAVTDLIKDRIQQQVHIKWPNDVYVAHQKIAGVLLENTIQANRKVKVVAGIGVNVNQVEFRELNATSLKLLTQQTYDVNTLCLELADLFYKRSKQSQRQLLNDVNQMLYKKGEAVTFSSALGNTTYTIDQILYSGKLRVRHKEAYKELDHNDVKWMK
jgi:BirA family biotin operon repressor/biotin-[acetyl-CoA-carboxylase] ligase